MIVIIFRVSIQSFPSPVHISQKKRYSQGNAISNKTPILSESMNKDIWVAGTSNLNLMRDS